MAFRVEMVPETILSFIGHGDRLDIVVFRRVENLSTQGPLSYDWELVIDGEITGRGFNRSSDTTSFYFNCESFWNINNQNQITMVSANTDFNVSLGADTIAEDTAITSTTYLHQLSPMQDFYTQVQKVYCKERSIGTDTSAEKISIMNEIIKESKINVSNDYMNSLKKVIADTKDNAKDKDLAKIKDKVPLASDLIKEAVKFGMGLTSHVQQAPSATFAHKFLANTGLLARISEYYGITGYFNNMLEILPKMLMEKVLLDYARTNASQRFMVIDFVDAFLKFLNYDTILIPNPRLIKKDSALAGYKVNSKNINDSVNYIYSNKGNDLYYKDEFKGTPKNDSNSKCKITFENVDLYFAKKDSKSNSYKFTKETQKVVDTKFDIDKLPQILVAPNSEFGIIPKCNVVFSNQTLDFRWESQDIVKPNVALITGEVFKAVFNNEKFNPFRNSENVVTMLQGNRTDDKGLTSIEDELKSFEILYKGPVLLSTELKDWMAGILAYTDRKTSNVKRLELLRSEVSSLEQVIKTSEERLKELEAMSDGSTVIVTSTTTADSKTKTTKNSVLKETLVNETKARIKEFEMSLAFINGEIESLEKSATADTAKLSIDHLKHVKDKLLESFLKMELFKARNNSNTFNMTCTYMPYILQGYDALFVNKEYPGMSFVARVEEIQHMLQSQQTILRLTNARNISYELARTTKPIFGNPDNIYDVNSMLFDYRAADIIYRNTFGCAAAVFGKDAEEFADRKLANSKAKDKEKEDLLNYLNSLPIFKVIQNKNKESGMFYELDIIINPDNKEIETALESTANAVKYQKRIVCNLREYYSFRSEALSNLDHYKTIFKEKGAEMALTQTDISNNQNNLAFTAPLELPAIAAIDTSPALPFMSMTNCKVEQDFNKKENIDVKTSKTDDAKLGFSIESKFEYDPIEILKYYRKKIWNI
jgi:hypothetical protein